MLQKLRKRKPPLLLNPPQIDPVLTPSPVQHLSPNVAGRPVDATFAFHQPQQPRVRLRKCLPLHASSVVRAAKPRLISRRLRLPASYVVCYRGPRLYFPGVNSAVVWSTASCVHARTSVATLTDRYAAHKQSQSHRRRSVRALPARAHSGLSILGETCRPALRDLRCTSRSPARSSCCPRTANCLKVRPTDRPPVWSGPVRTKTRTNNRSC